MGATNCFYDFLILRIKDYIPLTVKETDFAKGLIASYVGVTPQALCRIKKKLLRKN